MSNTNNENSGGFYGADGEYYPASSQPAQSRSYASEDDNMYPKRPNINYTTTAYPGTNPPAAANSSDSSGINGYSGPTKYCRFCGKKIPEQAVICTNCGCQVEDMRHDAPPQTVVVNNAVNTYANANSNNYRGREKSKWLAFFLCLFGGGLGLHKFYEGKVLMGFLYLFTGGLFGIGWFIDIIRHLFKPNPYTV